MSKEDSLPNELRKYIAEQQIATGEANYTDFRPTYQPELDRIRDESIAYYNAGLEIVATISKTDLERCRNLYKLRNGNDYDVEKLRRDCVLGRWVIVPRYILFIEEVRKLKEALA